METYSYKHLYMTISSSITDKSQNVETMQKSINWTDKQNVVYPYNEISSDFKMKCWNIYEPWRYYAKWDKPDRKGQIIYYSTYMKQYLE